MWLSLRKLGFYKKHHTILLLSTAWRLYDLNLPLHSSQHIPNPPLALHILAASRLTRHIRSSLPGSFNTLFLSSLCSLQLLDELRVTLRSLPAVRSERTRLARVSDDQILQLGARGG